MDPRRDTSLVVAIALAIAWSPDLVAGQSTFHLKPSVSATQVYESNLFSTASDRQADSITRFTPGVASEYRSPLWTWSARYSLDAERFVDHSELTAADARQHGVIGIVYRRSPRTTVAGSAEYLATRRPSELYETTGLSYTRARARRFSAHSRVTRQLDPVTEGTLQYVFTGDRLDGAFEDQTHTLHAGVTRRVTPRTTAVVRYRGDRYGFTSPEATTIVMSHALGAGFTYAITRRVSILLEAGPRLTDAVILPELSASVGWRPNPLAFSLSYGRTQSTAVGVIGPLDTQSLRANVAATLGRSAEFRFTPGAFRTTHAGRRADVLFLGIGLTHKLAARLALDVGFDGALQNGTVFSASLGPSIRRHTAWMRIVAAPKERNR